MGIKNKLIIFLFSFSCFLIIFSCFQFILGCFYLFWCLQWINWVFHAVNNHSSLVLSYSYQWIYSHVSIYLVFTHLYLFICTKLLAIYKVIYRVFLFSMYIFLPHMEAWEPHSMVILVCANLNFVKSYSILNFFAKKTFSL